MSKTKKVNTTVKVVCEDELSARIFFSYIQSFADQIQTQVKTAIAQHGGGVSDPNFEEFDEDKLTAKLMVVPQDKGDVFVLNDDGVLTVDSYKGVKDLECYGIISSQKVSIFERKEGGIDRFIAPVIDTTSLTVALEKFPEILKEQRESQLKQEEEANQVKQIAEVAES